MGMALLIIAIVLGGGFAALVHALVHAPEGIESESGFSYKAKKRKSARLLKPAALLDHHDAVPVHRVTAA